MAYQSNPPPPAEIVITQPPSTRIVASDTISLAPGGIVQFSGSNMRQNRLYFSITNLDAALFLKLQTLNAVNWGTAFAQRPIGYQTDADFQVYNPATNPTAIQFEVAEFYPDTGNQHGLARQTPRGAPGGGGAPSGGGGTSGGTSGGGGTQAGGGTQPR